MTTQIIEADLTWTGDSFASGIRIVINEEGRIEAVGELPDQSPTRRLAHKAILPGFVNAHSHAFQRGLRGRGETFPPDQPGSFWSWREEMYKLVEKMDEQSMYDLSRQAFAEMRLAGVSAVGEFHYLHHTDFGAGFAFDEIVLRAAADAGIRIVLLNAFYQTGGLNHTGHLPLAGGQKRFATRSLTEYWHQMDHLAKVLDPATQSLGVVAHSIRAVPLDLIEDLYREACARGLPFHMHVEEQPREIEDCIHHYGKPPMALLNGAIQIGPNFTAVHCTHTAAADMDDFLASGGNVCICPLTEANLGDGLANVPWILRNGGHISLGSDSNARISTIEEMRWLEYGQRLAHQKRGVMLDEQGRAARKLLECATANGARSLGQRLGAIKPGYHADFTVIDLQSPSLVGFGADTLLESLTFGAGNSAIAATCVAGRWSDLDIETDNGD